MSTRTAGTTIGRSMPRSTVLGGAALVATAALVITGPPSVMTIVAASLATALLALDPRLGPLPAAALVMLALPWGRGADTLTFEVRGLPIRPHDAVAAIGILAALPVLWHRRPARSPTLFVTLGLMALGGLALVVGVVLGNNARDIVRDARWWAFYSVILLALFGAGTRPTIARATLLGMTTFAAVVVVATILPAFPGGLTDQELAYDRGTLRMQFGNSAFLIVAVAYVTWSLLRRATWPRASWLVLLLTAVVLSLTRTSILTAGGVVGLCIVLDAARRLRARAVVRAFRPIGVIAIAGVLALGTGVVLNVFGTPVSGSTSPSGPSTVGGGSQQIGRLLFQEPSSGLGSLEQGRFPSYRAAAAVIRAHPLTGAGLGSLTDVDYAYSAARAHTLKRSPAVDDAYLTVGLKAGIPGIVVFAALMLATLLAAIRRGGRVAMWFVPAWIGLLVLSVTQAYAVTFYGPFVLALLIAYPVLQRGSSSLVDSRSTS